jgi:histone demethylase JARID1
MSAMTATLNMRPHMNAGALPTHHHTPPHQPPVLKATKPAPMSNSSAPSLPNEKIIIPLSARHAEPLDLNSVERRGYPTQVQEFQKPSRQHGLQEAPTYRPTEEEFKNPMEYIKKIAPEAKDFGICKIIPPDGWNPDFAIDTTVR